MLFSPTALKAPSTASAEKPIRGESLLRPADSLLLRLDAWVARYLPEKCNPLLQTGAIANSCFFVALITGIALLLWYVPSVHQAYDSMLALDQAPWTSGWVRSLHRYSSDACMFFVLLHAVKIFAARRFTGSRWLAWVTGALLLGLLWLVGWLGYWLVWDQRAQALAVGTGKVLDFLPIFIDPMSRAFLVDKAVNSLLFFIIFFTHMLLPMAMGIALWLHIARLARARFLTNRPLTLWIVGSLALISWLVPATVAERADMQVPPQSFSMDWWYLGPLTLSDRLGAGALWAILMLAGLAFYGMPWWLRRAKPEAATVTVSRCNSCGQCAQDCPYGAITMVPRTDGKDYEFQSQVDPGRCVGCGICSGSCDSLGVGLDWFAADEQRTRIDAWVQQDESAHIAFACAHSAGGKLTVEPESGKCAELPEYRVMEVPCAGWIHSLTLERAQQRGAGKVLIVSCATGNCRYREGPEILDLRMNHEQKPALRKERMDADAITTLHLGPGEKQTLLKEAKAQTSKARPGKLARALVAGLVLLGLSAIVVLGSDFHYASPKVEDALLVVSFKHSGQTKLGRLMTPEEKAKYPAYMKKERVEERRRNPVRLLVTLDDEPVWQQSYPARGLWSDGNSIAIEQIVVPPGSHTVHIYLGESADPEEWSFQSSATLDFSKERRQVVLFDRIHGFSWH